ncbi:hypothetical protein INT43_008848 [Umbelopsis isabellina]|uniref:RNI-like protein n=1 Tax=Mortierella isabellina TaxID=91625 RepID=A0A8H7UFM7_MORIS|nr:hypothetical protein INT43_008848 [Umbelopsis isabellina]
MGGRERKLTVDIIHILIHYLSDHETLLALALACDIATTPVAQHIWRCPKPKSIQHVEKLTQVVQQSLSSNAKKQGSRLLPFYRLWITGYDFSTLGPDSALHVPASSFTTLLTITTLRLEYLNLNHCIALSSDLVSRHMPSLRYLNLSSCTQFSSATLISILTQDLDSSLRTLDLSNCSINDAVIIRVARHHNRLRDLYLKHSGNISDSAIMALAESCPELEHIIIGLPHGIVQSNKITDTSMTTLAQSCPRLKTVICRGQTRITEKSKEMFDQKCPNIAICDLSAEEMSSHHQHIQTHN